MNNTEKLLTAIFIESMVSSAGTAMGVISVAAISVPVISWFFPSVKTSVVYVEEKGDSDE